MGPNAIDVKLARIASRLWVALVLVATALHLASVANAQTVSLKATGASDPAVPPPGHVELLPKKQAVEKITPAHEGPATFLVSAFENPEQSKVVAHLAGGLPAFVAERLEHVSGLRFVGPPLLLSPEGEIGPQVARFVIRGSFINLPRRRLKVEIAVHDLRGNASTAFSAVQEGGRDEADRLAVVAALAALAKVPNFHLPPSQPRVDAPFGRDPYAFTMYSRAVSTLFGLGGFNGGDDAAAKWLGRALVIDPKVPESRRLSGHLHLRAGRPGHARTQWLYAEDLAPNCPLLVGALAALDYSQGESTALERYQRLLSLDPYDDEARTTVAELYYGAGKLVRAQEFLERVLKSDPRNLRAQKNLTLVLSARQAGADLAKQLEGLVALDPGNLDARMELAAAYVAEGRLTDALKIYEGIVSDKPRYAPALKLAGDFSRRAGALQKAANYYMRLRRVSPADPRPVFLLGATYHQAGNLRAAERYFEEGAAYPGMRVDAFANLGALALQDGRVKEARYFLSKAVQWRPESAHVRYNMALVFRELEQHAEALNEAREAQRADPEHINAAFLAGVLSLRLGLLRDAELDFRRTLALHPSHAGARHNLDLLNALRAPGAEAQNYISVVP